VIVCLQTLEVRNPLEYLYEDIDSGLAEELVLRPRSGLQLIGGEWLVGKTGQSLLRVLGCEDYDSSLGLLHRED